MTPGQVDLVPSLARLVPPATVIDKTVYSSWTESRLDGLLAADAVCGFADETHDAAMTIFASRFGEQVELDSKEESLNAWPALTVWIVASEQ